MGATEMRVGRRLPIGGEWLAPVLLRLRRDLPDLVAYWTLGGRGAFEVDARFCEVGAPPATTGPAFAARGRLWDAGRRAMSIVDLVVVGLSGTESELTSTPATPLPVQWQSRLAEYAELERAALDELAEELLWHASRLRVENARA